MSSHTAITLDKEVIRLRYKKERDKRLRADGNDQYIRINGQLSHYLDDPYVPIKARQPRHDHVTFAFIGGGFAGLVTGARLTELGVKDVRVIEKGGDFGGTWYWNRYPGAMCDTAAFIYMPLLEETGHMPSEKYVHAPEILAHCQRIGQHYDLYDHALFHTEVKALVWDDAQALWHIKTDRGDDFTAQFVGMGVGPLHVPKLPGLAGIDDFKGHSFHTSRWDYDYTGGDPEGAPLTGLADKRVALIGTGATAVQCIPHLAAACQTLYVCQRTPSSVDVRDNKPTNPEWFKEMATPGWQQRWLENFCLNQTGQSVDEDLVQDGWTDLARRIRGKIASLPEEDRKNPLAMLRAYEDSDFEKMTAIRTRIDVEVRDQNTAEKLKAWYGQLCKRPCFHDEYLPAFNRPATVLLDTNGQGVERITAEGVVVAGTHYEVDCIIYATGFEVGTDFVRRAGFETIGRAGKTLSDHWQNGMHTLHGTHMHGFPNLFMVQPTQGANLISNVPHNIVESGKTIAMMVHHALNQGHQTLEVTAEAEKDWVALLLSGPAMMLGSPECTPGYYNNEGQPSELVRYNTGYPKGAAAYFEYLEQWRGQADFSGIRFG